MDCNLDSFGERDRPGRHVRRLAGHIPSLFFGWHTRLRACLEIANVPVLVPSPAWRGATSEHTRQRSVSEEQQSQAGLGDETLRAAVLLAGDGVGSFLTAHCGDARNSPPCPRPKSLTAGTFGIFRQALIARLERPCRVQRPRGTHLPPRFMGRGFPVSTSSPRPSPPVFLCIQAPLRFVLFNG
jgi:hypothetical protein